jgi:SAM-dependent methyltransferase
MSSQPVSREKPDPQPIFDIATGFMRAKHLFVAGELGVFEALAGGPMSLDEIAGKLRVPQRTLRIIVDAVTALGFLERVGDRYQNGPVAQAFLSGLGSPDMRAFIRFWNRLSYRRWLGLEDSVRLGRGVSGEFNFTADEWKIFSEGVEGFSAGQAHALVEAYDFNQHQRILDVGGGTGSFLLAILGRYPMPAGTLYELPQAAATAREKLRDHSLERRISIHEGDFLKDPIPNHHDAFLVANVVHVLVPEQNQFLFQRLRSSAKAGARFLLVDLWTNAEHTEPLVAALMAGEFLVVGGNGDVYSIQELRSWLDQTGWRFLEQKPLGGPASLVVAEAV